MAEENKTLEFKITTSAELAGAQATAAALEKQIGKAKALGQDYAALSAQLARVKTAIAATGGGAEMFGVHMVSLGEGMHKAEEKMEGIGGESREL